MAVLNFGFKNTHGFIGRRRQRLARAQAESRPVARADDFIALDFAAGQLRPVVGANILNRKIVVAAANDGNHAPADRNGVGLTVAQIVDESRINPRQQNALSSHPTLHHIPQRITSCRSAGGPRPTSWFDSTVDQIPTPRWLAPRWE